MAQSYGFSITGIEPLDIEAYGEHARREFWRAVLAFGLQEKDAELAAGKDIRGRRLKPIAPSTRKYRRSWTGHADPNAPPLTPAYRSSRTRVLLDGRAHRDRAEFFWRADPVSGRPWGRVLGYHRDAAGYLPERDVIGISPQALKRVKAKAWKAWERIRAGAPAPKKKDVIGQLNLPKPTPAPKPAKPTKPAPLPKPPPTVEMIPEPAPAPKRGEPIPPRPTPPVIPKPAPKPAPSPKPPKSAPIPAPPARPAGSRGKAPRVIYLKPGEKPKRRPGGIQVYEVPDRPGRPPAAGAPTPPKPKPAPESPAPPPKPPKPAAPPKPAPKPVELNPRPKQPGPRKGATPPIPTLPKNPTTPKDRWIAGSIKEAERQGFKATKMDLKTVAKITGFTEEEARRMPGFYYAGDAKFPEQIVINTGATHWQATDRQAQADGDYQRKWFSTDSTMHFISHEIGHGKHARNIGAEAFQHGHNQPFSDDQKAEIAASISRYAATDRHEFVAEVYAKLDSGHVVPKKLLELYDSLGGVRP